MEQLSQIHKLMPSIKTLRNMPAMARREFRNGILFSLPWILGFLGFTLIPMVATLVFSFMNLDITDGVLSKPDFVGLDNYKTLFSDPQVWNARPNSTPGSLWVTIRFGLIALPVGIFLPLLLAILMNNKYLKGKNFFRTMFYVSVLFWEYAIRAFGIRAHNPHNRTGETPSCHWDSQASGLRLPGSE